MASYQRSYQGYPYVNPPVIDAPSIDQATASRWANLPRKQIHVPTRKDDQPVVYINVPEDGPGTSSVLEEVENQTDEPTPEPRVSLPAKKEIDETPVVYIDLPENRTGDETENRAEEGDSNEPEFVRETIFYDPFEDRRIDSTDRTKAEVNDTASETSSVHSIAGPANRPVRPNTLNFDSPGSSGYNSQPTNSSTLPTISSNSPMIPPMLSKEASIYGRMPAEDFSISPIPVSSFPEPPPAYTEIDRASTPSHAIVEQPRRPSATTTPPPRTQVITYTNQNSGLAQGSPIDHQIPIGMPNTDRKYLNCHHCGMRVHTLVVREMGPLAIILSVICLVICMLPIIFLIYTTTCFKNKNHYCPNCNKLIGYQLPFNGDKVTYVN